MKKNTYTLNTLLAMVLGATLLAAVLVRTFAPRIIIAELDIPNMVLISLVTLVLDHYLAPDAKLCYVCIPVFSAISATDKPSISRSSLIRPAISLILKSSSLICSILFLHFGRNTKSSPQSYDFETSVA